MTDPSRIIEAVHPTRGRLFAAIDSSIRFVKGSPAEHKFAAFLSPYRDEAAARAGLEAAGAVVGEAR